MKKNQSLMTPLSATKQLNLESSETGISIYKKGNITPDKMLIEIARLKAAFPSLPSSFFDILRERVIDHKFTNERLHDAISYIIDNCHYPTPSIADIINYDKKIKYYTYEEIIKKSTEFGGEIWDKYKPIKLFPNMNPVWIHISDIEKYKFK